MAMNILGEGKERLEELILRVETLERAEEEERSLFEKEKHLESRIENREKQVLLEISETVHKRREELEKSFRLEEEKIEKLIRQLQGKREKARSGKVSERISVETEPFYLQNKEIKKDAKRLFKQNKVPGFLNTGVYYTLFSPRSFQEIVICGLLFLLLFGGFPYFLWRLQPEPRGEISLIFIYLGVIFLFGGFYLWIFSKSRTKYGAMIAEGRLAREKIRKNQKIIKRIEKNIKKDKDDSGYGLQDYDSGLHDLKIQSEDIHAGKKEALRNFEEETKKAIAQEIENLHREELEALKEEKTAIASALKSLRERVKQEKLELSKNYETYLGKESVNVEELRVLLRLMEGGNLPTIGEALEARKQEMNEEERNG